MSARRVVMLLLLWSACCPAWGASGLLWNKVAGRDDAEAERPPEWTCTPHTEEDERWRCRGGEPEQVVKDFDPEQLGEQQPPPIQSDDLATAYFVPRDQLPEATVAAMPEFCAGAYVEPTYPLPLDSDPDDYPIVTEADKITYEFGRQVTLEGDVRFAQGNRSLVAARATVDNKSRKGELSGGVRLQEPGLLLQGEQARVDLNSDEAELDDAQFLILANNFRGETETLYQNADGDLNMKGNEFTRCDPGNNNWRLTTSELGVEKGEVFGTARNATLRLKNVPIFYTPYLKFPVSSERQSGFLFPNIGQSDEDGLDLTIPYYLNLAPNYDATIVPHYIGKRGVGLEAEFRHLASWQDFVFTGGFLEKDDLFDGTFERKDFEELFPGEEFEPADRWLIAVDQVGQIGPVQTIVDYVAVSDRDYFRDLGTGLAQSSQIELERRGELRYARDNLNVRLWAQRFQRLDELTIDPYERLPELAVAYTRNLGPLRFSLDTRGSSFDRRTENLGGLAAVTGERYMAEPRLQLPLDWPFGFVHFTTGYNYAQYDLEQDSRAGGFQLVDDSPDRGVGFGSVDAGLFFEREVTYRDTPIVHTLEPRMYYLYREFEDQSGIPFFDSSPLSFNYNQLYRERRFSGFDRLSDANQLSTGVTTRFLNANTGREYFRASIGQINYFEDRRVTTSGVQGIEERRSSSAIASEMAAAVTQHWSVFGGIVWDPHDNQVDESSAFIQYRRSNNQIFNVGYRYFPQSRIRQSDLSVYWPIGRNWAIFGRWNWDFVSERTIEGLGGIEYNDCCLQIRLMSHRFLDSPTGTNFNEVRGDEGIFFQIVFKGLAGFGQKVESVLSRGIRGYYTEQQPGYTTW